MKFSQEKKPKAKIKILRKTKRHKISQILAKVEKIKPSMFVVRYQTNDRQLLAGCELISFLYRVKKKKIAKFSFHRIFFSIQCTILPFFSSKLKNLFFFHFFFYSIFLFFSIHLNAEIYMLGNYVDIQPAKLMIFFCLVAGQGKRF